jgi:hypothetical protein
MNFLDGCTHFSLDSARPGMQGLPIKEEGSSFCALGRQSPRLGVALLAKALMPKRFAPRAVTYHSMFAAVWKSAKRAQAKYAAAACAGAAERRRFLPVFELSEPRFILLLTKRENSYNMGVSRNINIAGGLFGRMQEASANLAQERCCKKRVHTLFAPNLEAWATS